MAVITQVFRFGHSNISTLSVIFNMTYQKFSISRRAEAIVLGNTPTSREKASSQTWEEIAASNQFSN
jgi:hypothetical protein